MNFYILALLSVLLAYLIGAIPFAFLIVYAIKRVDIRTVGSGNVGATNAGRLLGFKYFVLVFALDVAKGLLPTLGFPRLVEAATGRSLPGLDVIIALAAILGHNFPVYLRFRGGKGVATSLGAVSALDWLASLSTLGAFIVFLVVTRYVSMASVLGGLFFLVAHFARVRNPWGSNQVVMSVATILLVGMLIVRHRQNFVRIAAGTEPKVTFRRKRPRDGRAWVVAVVLLALVGSGTVVAVYSAGPATLDCGAVRLIAEPPVRTGHQRAERVALADAGRMLAVTCPRYNRLVLYRVNRQGPLELAHDVLLEGRPVAVAPGRDRFYVLERPSSDARHLEEGWLEAIDLGGRRLGNRFRVGYDPDDIVLSPDGRTALVVRSGSAEGEANRPNPSLVVVDLSDPGSPRARGGLSFDSTGDDPERVAWVFETQGERALVSLRGTNQIAWVDVRDRDAPRLLGRSPLPEGAAGQVGAVAVLPGSGYRCGIDARRSAIEVLEPAGDRCVGALPLRGTGGFTKVVPVAIAAAEGVVAVADRSGGVHLVRVASTH
jgi:glycerol-3-phosphate acyltransferase PlsY